MTVQMQGTVHFHDLGSGSGVWTIDAGGELYEIVGDLDASFQVEGLLVAFDALFRSDLTGVVLGSRVIEIVQIHVQ